MKKLLLTTGLSAMLLLNSCSSTLESESGLYDVKLENCYKDPVDGSWVWDGTHPYAHSKNIRLYLAPLDLSLISKEHPDLAPLLAEQFEERIFEQFSEYLNAHNTEGGIGWSLTKDPKGAQMRINFAVVKFSPQYPVLRTLIAAGSLFSPIPGTGTIAASFAEGSIEVEATIRDTKTNQLYLAFKDSNRKSAYIYTASAYSSIGQADINFKHWAAKMASLLSKCQTEETCYVDYQTEVDNKHWLAALWEHIPFPEF